MRRIGLLSLIFAICAGVSSPLTASPAVRVQQDFSSGWKFLLMDEAGMESSDFGSRLGWVAVELPHTWNTKDTFDEVHRLSHLDGAAGKSCGRFHSGPGRTGSARSAGRARIRSRIL